MTIRTKALRWAMVAGVLLALVWAIAPGTQLPLYDGVGFPDEPYRWVERPAGAPATLTATDIVERFPVTGGTNPAEAQATTAEQGPQAVVWILPGALIAPPDATSAVLRVSPVGTPTAPKEGDLYSNVYHVGTQTSSGAASLSTTVKPPAAIFLRGPTATDRQVRLEEFRGGRWSPVPGTQRTGQDIWGGYITEFGDYALVVSGSAPQSTTAAAGGPAPSGPVAGGATGSGGAASPGDAASSGSTSPLLLTLGGVALILGALIGAVRFSRRRRPQPPAT